jgi:hypothetical protein
MSLLLPDRVNANKRFSNSIIQNSKADWDREGLKMKDVYGSSVCTLAACLSLPSEEGLFVQRDPSGGQAIIYKNHPFADRAVKFTLYPTWIVWTRKYAPLYSRSWVVQERILSPRIIHFSEFPFFECNKNFANETYSTSNLPKDPFLFPQHPEPERVWTTQSDGNTLIHWMRMLELYSNCKLTFYSDKFIALSGLAAAFSNLLDREYYAGIFAGDCIVSCLLWEIWASGPRERPAEYQGKKYSKLPIFYIPSARYFKKYS